MDNAVVIIASMVGCTAFWQLVDHILSALRKKKFDAEASLQNIETRLDKMETNQDNMQRSLASLSATVAENDAVTRRVRILQAADEIYMGQNHSKDMSDQNLSDIDHYERYCREHPNFANGVTQMSCEVIREKYRENERNHSFLTAKH